MVAYNFQKQFVDDIRAGVKSQTIRRKRKRQASPGDMLQIYTGMRTRSCQKIIDDQECLCVDDILIQVEHCGAQQSFVDYALSVTVNGIKLSVSEKYELAMLDGFDTSADFDAYFRKQGLPFYGDIIKW